ncbi:MAG: peptidylprolyl isomerase [archaeon]
MPSAKTKKEEINLETKKEIVVLETTYGNIEIELNREKAPITVENFLSYVNSDFYNGTVFHRVIGSFMIQGGGFLPNGNQKKTNAPIILESNNGLKNLTGTIAMARTSSPDSATSQFFINLQDNAFLDYGARDEGYAVFGKVISGMDVVTKIGSVKTKTTPMADWPAENIIITKAYVK